ncbi:hypothetical protein caldi_27800 [Caldinitratiruptor microaerophilus]|uniref:Uncharacterized protein n=1 Tax=Caldinitratiruptor microaerophilus TaxID=671077 RepID=A0AA35CPY2_9FIRM|nr:hypothetical protein caldi_27800 [Caldinitratiruptor microaerophilus]
MYLGWHHLTDTSPAGAAAIELLCRALGVDTFREPDACRLYLRSPVRGHTLILGGEPDFAGAIRGAAALLRGAGARVYTTSADEPLAGQLDRLRQVAPAALAYLRRADARLVRCTVYGPLSRSSRDLAEHLGAAIAGEADLPLLPARPAWREELPLRRAGGCAVLVELPASDPELLARGLFAGITRAFAPPDLARFLDQFAQTRRLAALLHSLAKALRSKSGQDAPGAPHPGPQGEPGAGDTPVAGAVPDGLPEDGEAPALLTAPAGTGEPGPDARAGGPDPGDRAAPDESPPASGTDQDGTRAAPADEPAPAPSPAQPATPAGRSGPRSTPGLPPWPGRVYTFRAMPGGAAFLPLSPQHGGALTPPVNATLARSGIPFRPPPTSAPEPEPAPDRPSGALPPEPGVAPAPEAAPEPGPVTPPAADAAGDMTEEPATQSAASSGVSPPPVVPPLAGGEDDHPRNTADGPRPAQPGPPARAPRTVRHLHWVSSRC